jgi:hypothetical protein
MTMEVRFQELLSNLDAACREGQHRAYLQLLDEGYVRVSASERDALRAIFRANGELDHQVAKQTSRVAELAHDAGEVEASVRVCMLGISLRHRYDSRDISVLLGDLWRWLESKGVDPAPLFHEIAEVSSSERTHVYCGSVQEMICYVAEHQTLQVRDTEPE